MNKKVIGLLLFADVFVYLSGKIYEGFNLHTMWGLYADKGYGACLVFDKNKLKLAEGDYARDVEYMDYVLPDYAFRIWEGSHYMDIKSIDRKLPVLSYEFGLNWYELWRDVPDDPIWTEMSGFYI